MPTIGGNYYAPDQLEQAPLDHGTLNAYQYHKCRCDRCKKANSDYHKARRAEKKKERTAIDHHKVADAIASQRPSPIQTFITTPWRDGHWPDALPMGTDDWTEYLPPSKDNPELNDPPDNPQE